MQMTALCLITHCLLLVRVIKDGKEPLINIKRQPVTLFRSYF